MSGYSWNYSSDRMNTRGEEDKFVFTCDNLASQSFQLMHAMLREKSFCDVVLNVDGTYVYAHRIVLACSSPFLMELFQNESQYFRQNGSKSSPLYYYTLSFALEPFMVLINFMYTGRLELNPAFVSQVYKTAKGLRIQSVVDACTQYLSNKLNVANCLEVRRIASDAMLIEKVEDFIRERFTFLIETKDFKSLPRLSIEIEGVTLPDFHPFDLFEYLLKWFRSELTKNDLDIIGFTETFANVTHRIHVRRFDSEENDGEITDDCQHSNWYESNECCKDYYITMTEFISLTPNEEDSNEMDSKVLQVLMTSKKRCIGLVMLKDELLTLSVNLDWSSCKSPGSSSPSDAAELDVVENDLALAYDDSIPSLKEPRAGLGLVSINDEIIIIGGFNSTSCLNSVECYESSSNAWNSLPNLKFRRGRHCTAIVGGKIYVFGGSDGTQSLMNAECYDFINKTWMVVPDFCLPKDNPAVVSCGRYIYAVGGTNGPSSCTELFRYDCLFSCWTQLKSMNTPRANPCAVLYENSLYVFGGHDGWRCLSSCEVYKPSLDQWVELPSMPVARRSCGVICSEGKIYIIGGTDGSYTLSRVDIFNPKIKCWEKGPNMRVPRSGLGVTILKGKLFVTGGYDGKNFLKSSEILVDLGAWKPCGRSHSESESEKCVLPVFDCKETTGCD